MVKRGAGFREGMQLSSLGSCMESTIGPAASQSILLGAEEIEEEELKLGRHTRKNVANSRSKLEASISGNSTLLGF